MSKKLDGKKIENKEKLSTLKKRGSVPQRTIIFHVMIWLLVVLVVLLSTGIIIKSYKSVQHKIEITIDPVVVSHLGEDHVNSAQHFTLGPKDKEKRWISKIEVGLTHNQSFVYNCMVNCNGKKPFDIDLNISIDQLDNIAIFYQINDEDEFVYTEGLCDLFVGSGENLSIKIIIRIIDQDKSAYVSGNMSISASETSGVER